ncbi:hypothetical protein [Bacillus pumilus]|nr:hypothetical protein [Bacillus pumilus]
MKDSERVGDEKRDVDCDVVEGEKNKGCFGDGVVMVYIKVF